MMLANLTESEIDKIKTADEKRSLEPVNHMYTIRIAEERDILQIVKVHLEAFKGYFLSLFGPGFLNIFYQAWLHSNQHILIVAEMENKVCGFVAGTFGPNLLFKSIFRNHFFEIAGIALSRLAHNHAFRREFLKRISFIKTALKSKLSFAKERPSQNANESPDKAGRLLSIAVLENVRGKGVSQSLIRKFEELMFIEGVSTCGLTAKRENHRAIGFYKKAGWQIEKSSKSSMSFVKRLE